MADYSPRYRPGKELSYRATTAITGGQAVIVTGDYAAGVGAAGVTTLAGVATCDAKVGDLFPVSSGGVQRLIASGAIAAGDRVALAADGKVATATEATIGTALKGAANGARADIRLDV